MGQEKAAGHGAGQRDLGADIVRIAALILLLWLHFFHRNGFYFREAGDFWGFAAVTFRPIFMCCVPLFMTLTGYLRCGKPWNIRQYRSLLPVVLSYVLISGIMLLYKILWLKQAQSFGAWLLDFLQFKLADYGWYVGMYIGLFLVSPLLNVLWAACGSRKAHLAVVLTFIALTFLPATANSTPLGNLLPAYFQPVYYVTFYVIGCYIRTYRPAPRRWVCILVLLAVGALLAWLNLATRTEAAKFYSGYDTGYNNLFSGVITTTLFLLFYQCRSDSHRLKRIAAHVSGVVFEIYLLSYIADSNIYTLFYKKYPMSLYLPIGLSMSLAVLVLTYPAALGVNRLVRWITSGFRLRKRTQAQGS